MKTWETEFATIQEVGFDYDLNALEVYDKEGSYLGMIIQDTTEQLEVLKKQLDEGSCPIADEWENGNGETCTLKGW